MRVQQGWTAVDKRARGDSSDKVEIHALPEPAQLRDLSEFMERIRKERLVKIRPAIKVIPEKKNVDIEIIEEIDDELK
jgi:hypothetical protein